MILLSKLPEAEPFRTGLSVQNWAGRRELDNKNMLLHHSNSRVDEVQRSVSNQLKQSDIHE
ncbi:hypothetical protein [Desulfonema magnum]|uniref:hypothetical protein n=1 Tax=Desulfonema magnum TaxID=45655 RepID=UPI001A9C25FC|nr:hypothetical protein [Desulfonema magnum]